MHYMNIHHWDNHVIGGSDSCSGDSGGPLWTIGLDGLPVLIGSIIALV